MKKCFVLLLLCHAASPVKHDLKYFYTGSYGVPNFPEFVAVGLIDEVPAGYCDSITRRAAPKQDWGNRITEEDPLYWEWNTENCVVAEHNFKVLIDSLKRRFNETGGVHTYQNMYGCEWDDETEEVHGYEQHGYDGEDFISFDLKTMTWIAPTPQAAIMKHEWDRNKIKNEYLKNYLTQECIVWLKKYLDYGKSYLLRKELPSVSLLQKTPSSPVSCHATGFFPHRAVMFWRKDGEELHEDVDQGEILPNHDETFQMSVDLNISSVTPEDWRRYNCVFQLSGVREDVVTRLDKRAVETNWGKPGVRGDGEKSSPLIAIIIAAVAVLALVIGAVGFFIYRKKSAKRPPSQSCSSTGSSVESGDNSKPLMKDKSDA